MAKNAKAPLSLHKTLHSARTRLTSTPHCLAQRRNDVPLSGDTTMTDINETPATPAAATPTATAAKRSKKPWIAAIGAVVIATTGALSWQAFARNADGMMWGNPMQRMERLLDEVKATDAQKDQIATILKDARKDLAGLRGEREAIAKELSEILSAPTIDRSKLESARSERIRKLDEASRRVTTAIADAADVLKPEQRAELVKMMESRMKARKRWSQDRGNDQN
jgi:Spy/CpxP family protein refolding chaperone